VADMQGAQTNLLRRIKERFDEEGITIPYPQSEIRVVGTPPTEQPTANRPL
jgi:small conductance mechanosensitive channel